MQTSFRDYVREAIEQISSTIGDCIQFKEIQYKEDDNSNHIMITCEHPETGKFGQGCFSALGMLGGRQRMSLETPECAERKTKGFKLRV